MGSAMSVKMRQHVEREIADAAIKGLLAAGHDLSVNDTEEWSILNSRDAAAVLAAMFQADEEWLCVDVKPANTAKRDCYGWVRFIYGNDGWDVINDYSTNLEGPLTAANALAKFWMG